MSTSVPASGADGAACPDLREEVDRLRADLAVAEDVGERALSEVHLLEARIARVHALCDLAAWAEAAAGDGGDPSRPVVVRVDDVRHALGTDR